jgi:fermentation-respiration switch protein FrsA (DUF1100 family)
MPVTNQAEREADETHPGLETSVTAVTLIDAVRFCFFVTLAMRLILLRDSFARSGAVATPATHLAFRRTSLTIDGGDRKLEALLVCPANAPIASVLILHGIGERLEYWAEAQQLLTSHQIASLIVHYSGYGGSEGAITPANLRRDVIAAYATMRQRLPEVKSHFVLGLSLGTGVAIEAAPALTPPPAGIILCEAFSSFRQAAAAVCETLRLLRPFSRPLSFLVPDIYRTAASVRRLGSPLLLVHSDDDELFPAAMARTIFDTASRNAEASVELQVLHGFAHNDAYLRPHSGYWQPILAFIERVAKRSVARIEDGPER